MGGSGPPGFRIGIFKEEHPPFSFSFVCDRPDFKTPKLKAVHDFSLSTNHSQTYME
jgi:hypothetical protein